MAENLSDLTQEQLTQMINPLSPEEIQSLRDVIVIADATDKLLTNAELAGIDVSGYRQQINESRNRATGLLAAFAPTQPQAPENPLG